MGLDTFLPLCHRDPSKPYLLAEDIVSVGMNGLLSRSDATFWERLGLKLRLISGTKSVRSCVRNCEMLRTVLEVTCVTIGTSVWFLGGF